AAFVRGWAFASACFGLVAVGAVALRRTEAAPKMAAFIEGVRSMVATETPAPVAPRQERYTQSVILSLRVRPPVLGQSTEDFIAAVPLFSGLSPAEIAALAKRATTVTLGAGAWLYHEGDIADGMYVVRSGRIQMVDERRDGGPQIIRELRPGAVLGELALIRRSRRTAGARVRRDAVLLRIDQAAFEEILGSSSHVSRVLLTTLAERLTNGT